MIEIHTYLTIANYFIFNLSFKVEKSLQRIHRGQKNAMYTTQKSIENKVRTHVVLLKQHYYFIKYINSINNPSLN